MHVLPAGGDRFIMTHADAMYIGQHPLNSRENLALWFTRGDGVDFIAGPAYTADENATAYPQMWIHDGKMLACYSKGIRPRSIKVAHISPVPDPDTYYILPRDNRGLVESIKIDGRNALQFYDNYNSAGLDLDENDRMNNKVTVEFQFKIEKGNENALCTVGDAHHPAQVVVKDDQIYLQDSDEKITCGQAKGWTKVTVETFKKTTRVKVGDGKFKSVTHDPMATWFYFGQGYYRGRTVIWKNRFVIDVDSVQSRVTKLQ
jgi:hypothetical protein